MITVANLTVDSDGCRWRWSASILISGAKTTWPIGYTYLTALTQPEARQQAEKGVDALIRALEKDSASRDTS